MHARIVVHGPSPRTRKEDRGSLALTCRQGIYLFLGSILQFLECMESAR